MFQLKTALASNVSILMNNGDGTFAAPVIFEGNGTGETGCATADVNGDGTVDITDVMGVMNEILGTSN